MGKIIINNESLSKELEDLKEEIERLNLEKKRLMKIEEKYDQFLTNSKQPIVIHIDGTIVYGNKSASELFEEDSPTSIIGKSVFKYLHQDTKDLVNKRIKNVYETEKTMPLKEEKVYTNKGKLIQVAVAGHLTKYNGKNAVILYIHDIQSGSGIK